MERRYVCAGTGLRLCVTDSRCDCVFNFTVCPCHHLEVDHSFVVIPEHELRSAHIVSAHNSLFSHRQAAQNPMESADIKFKPNIGPTDVSSVIEVYVIGSWKKQLEYT